MRIFVPGRICLFGEHSDWAGGYRRINAEIEKGYTLICGTNQGIHAEVEPHPTALVMTSTTPDGKTVGPYEIPLEPKALLEEARRGGFYSYAAGVAFQVLTHYRVRGLAIRNFRTDLPIKKGLSSSAAISVLTARAFNRVYDLRLTVRGEMELAYQGEITTPSRCGRVGECTAFLASFLVRRHFEQVTGEAKRYQDLSMEALKAGDRPAYEAANKLANEAFGKSFYSQVALSATFVWPIFLALGWMQHRFLEVTFPLPVIGFSLGYIGVFLVLYIAAYFMVKPVKRRLPYYRRIHELRDASGRPARNLKSFGEPQSP